MSGRAVVLFVLSLLVSGSSVFAIPLLTESFSYGDGSLVTVSGGKWVTHSGTTGQVDVVSGRVFLTQSESEDVSSLLETNSASTLYVGLKLNVTNLPTGGIAYFAHFKDSTASNFRGKLFVTTNGATVGSFRLGIANGANTPNVLNSADLTLNTDYAVVLRYVATNTATTLWINPSSESDPSITASDSAVAISAVALAFRQQSAIGQVFVDDVVVGTSFGDLTTSGTAPTITTHPQTQTVTEGANVTFGVGASGTAPMSYQWFFNNAVIASATNSALVLTNVALTDAGQYAAVVANNFGSATSQTAVLTVNSAFVPTRLSILHYNVKGNGATNWSTNSLQVQAIGREVAYLNPDIIAFNEIPYSHTYEMTNFVKAFLPGYFLATNSGTDGFIRSVVASRYPITRSKSWLDGANLDPFGYTNSNFTRDLFEAQITVPNFDQPLHVFTSHLKSSASGYTDAAAKRAAEAAAITNFFTTNFFVLYPGHCYSLSGDFNESDTNTLAIQRLLSPNGGLHLTNPTNPVTGTINTYSIQGSVSERLDYIMPGGVLATNIYSSQVFRSDKVSPIPADLLSTDSATASDHLPVLMVFDNPFNTPFQISSITDSNQQVTLSWPTATNRQYRVDGSIDLTNWTAISSTLTASGTNDVFTTNVNDAVKFFRVYRTP